MSDPLELINSQPPPKRAFKEYVSIVISAYHEAQQRRKSEGCTSMKYFNVSLLNLSGRCHPSISNAFTAQEVSNMRPHLKFLVGDYLSSDKKTRQSGGSPNCRVCDLETPETYKHILVQCLFYNNVRSKILSEMKEFCHSIHFYEINDIMTNQDTLTQFILDPSSMNLKKRININDENLPKLFTISRNLCNSIHQARLKKLSGDMTH